MLCYEEVPKPELIDPFLANYLSLYGLNQLACALLVLSGSAAEPGLAVQGDPKTGLYQRVPGELSLALAGLERVRWTRAGLTLVARGKLGTLSHQNTADRTYTLPDRSGELALAEDALPTFSAENKQGGIIRAGQVVALYSTGVGVVLARATDGARLGVGLARADVADTFGAEVQLDGKLWLADWSLVTESGSATLSRGDWFLSDSDFGKLTQTCPTAAGTRRFLVGTSLDPNTLNLKLEYLGTN